MSGQTNERTDGQTDEQQGSYYIYARHSLLLFYNNKGRAKNDELPKSGKLTPFEAEGKWSVTARIVTMG